MTDPANRAYAEWDHSDAWSSVAVVALDGTAETGRLRLDLDAARELRDALTELLS